jgi:cytochrome bd-I ubiquinol oxidase subunit X
MWYFAWVLGTGFAGVFSILNAMWLELHEIKPVGARDDLRAP